MIVTATQGKYSVLAKVRLADIVTVARGDEHWQSQFNRISSKHADFVLCALESFEPLLVIELDDASHDRTDAQQRDMVKSKALEAARVPLLRLRAKNVSTPQDLARRIDHAIAARRVGERAVKA